MRRGSRGQGGSTVRGLGAIAAVALASGVIGGETPTAASSLWFDPTQLPSFRGSVERYVANPNGHPDRLIFKEGTQIVFPPEILDALEKAAPAGKELVVWGIRARNAPIITMLAFGVPDGKATILDRFYWRPVRGKPCSDHELVLSGKVRMPYLTPEGGVSGAILEDGSVIRIDPEIAPTVRDRLAEHANLSASGPGCVTPFGQAIEAQKLGETDVSLRELPAGSQKPESR